MFSPWHRIHTLGIVEEMELLKWYSIFFFFGLGRDKVSYIAIAERHIVDILFIVC